MLFKKNEQKLSYLTAHDDERIREFDNHYKEYIKKYVQYKHLLLEDIDKLITEIITGIIINFEMDLTIRSDLINGLNTIIRCREVLIDKNSNCSNDNRKK